MIKVDLVVQYVVGSRAYIFSVNGKNVLSIFESEIIFKPNPYNFLIQTIMKRMYGDNINVKRKIMWMENNSNLPLLLANLIN